MVVVAIIVVGGGGGERGLTAGARTSVHLLIPPAPSFVVS